MIRYSRQEKFIGKSAQEKLENSSVTILGCGALGSSSAEIMVRAGIKKIILIDFDVVELSNLQRQTCYLERDVGQLKVEVLRKHLRGINSKVDVVSKNVKIDKNNLNILRSNLIIDGTDNFETRYLANEYAVKEKIPFIFGSTVKSEGIIFPSLPGGPCVKCAFPNNIDTGKAGDLGIIASAPRTVSAIQTAIAIKILTGEKVESDILKFNLYDNEFYKAKVKKNPNCPICSN